MIHSRDFLFKLIYFNLPNPSLNRLKPCCAHLLILVEKQKLSLIKNTIKIFYEKIIILIIYSDYFFI